LVFFIGRLEDGTGLGVEALRVLLVEDEELSEVILGAALEQERMLSNKRSDNERA